MSTGKTDAGRGSAPPQAADDGAAAFPGARSEGVSPGGRLERILRSMRQNARQVFGIPDYERYLAHCAAHHPGEPVLSRREFFEQAIDRKYCKGGPRCC